jgi:hypothetical protein
MELAKCDLTWRVLQKRTLCLIFSREILKGVKERSHMASASQTHFMFNLYKGTSIGLPGIALLLFFSREILRVVKKVSHWIFLNLSVLKGKFEDGKQAIGAVG